MNDLSDLFGGVPFDPAAVEPQDDFQVLPPGKYPVLIEEAEVKVTKKQTGHYIYLKMKILDGPGKGRYVFDQINVQNPSTECVKIGLRELSALVWALGLRGEEWKNLDLYVNKVVIAHVRVKDEQNNVRTYSSAAAPISAPAPAPTPGTIAPAPVAAQQHLAMNPPTGAAAPSPTVAPTTPPPVAPVAPTPVASVAPSADAAGIPPWQR